MARIQKQATATADPGGMTKQKTGQLQLQL
jgi:hypothetical protein